MFTAGAAVQNQAYSEIVRENIDMESLMQRYPYEQKDVQEIYDLIVETVVGEGGSMTISGQQYPRELVKSRFLKLNMSHVEYVMECLRKNTTKVYNICLNINYIKCYIVSQSV